MKTKHSLVVLAVLLGALASGQGQAQTAFTENFTGTSTVNSWYFFNGACLTAGTSTSTTSPGIVPSCQSVWSNYYSSRQDSDPYLVGGNSGYLGTSATPSSGATQTPDPVNSGALRFTNGVSLRTSGEGRHRLGEHLRYRLWNSSHIQDRDLPRRFGWHGQGRRRRHQFLS